MKIFLRILRYVKPYWKNLILSILCTAFFSLFSGASAYLFIPLLETLFNPNATSAVQNFQQSYNINLNFRQEVEMFFKNILLSGTQSEALLKICFMLVIVFLLKNIFDYCQSYLMAYVEQRLMMDIRNDVYEHLHNLSLSYFTNERTGNLISRITNDVNIVNGGISTTFVTLIKEPLLVIVFLVLAFSLSWQLTIISFVVFPFALLIISTIGLKLHKQSGIMQEKMADITSVLQETISNIKVVKAFAMEDFENKKFQKETKSYFRTILKLARIRNFSSPTTEFLSVLAGAIIIWYGGQQVLVQNTMKASEFLGFLFIIFQLMPPIKSLSSVHNRLQEFSAAGKRIFEILDTEPAVKNSHNPVIVQTIQKNIEFSNVSFSYSQENEQPILSNINISVKKGEVLALVGPSGSGKTTLVDLLPRFYDPIDGIISIDGINIKNIELQSLRKLIGIVTQETILFNDTIKNNIAYGLTEFSEEKIREAAQAANALAFIEEMPKKFNSIIGDRGVKLSGGQRQRISIARALLKNPPIMIFDEATSALDSESELVVQEAIERLMKNRTSFIIAHRLSTIRNADRIIVLEKGKIVQEGKHTTLLKQKNGLYRKLHDMQFMI